MWQVVRPLKTKEKDKTLKRKKYIFKEAKIQLTFQPLRYRKQLNDIVKALKEKKNPNQEFCTYWNYSAKMKEMYTLFQADKPSGYAPLSIGFTKQITVFTVFILIGFVVLLQSATNNICRALIKPQAWGSSEPRPVGDCTGCIPM